MLTAHAVNRTATSTLVIAGSCNAAKGIACKAWTRLGSRVPNFVFRRIHISFTESGAILGSCVKPQPHIQRIVTAGLILAIHVFRSAEIEGVGARTGGAHDVSGRVRCARESIRGLSGSLNSLICCWWGRACGRHAELRETEMKATRFERAAAALFAGVSLAAMIAAFATGAVRAQPAPTTPIPQPAPTFNPSSPNTVPQAPYTPVAPSSPGNGLSGSGAAPISPSVVAPVPSDNAQQTPSPQTANAPAGARSAPPRTHAHHAGARAHWNRHYRRYRAPRPLGPSYYPGLGEFYPPYVNPCHLRQVWHGYYAGYWAYSCGW
jgi:hypothetical protein